jgi:hypothetical protein
MAGRQTKPNRLSPSAKARRRQMLGLSASAAAFLAFGLSPLATAPPAKADVFDAILDPIILPLQQALTGVSDALSGIDPTAALDLGVVGSHAADAGNLGLGAATSPVDSWLHGLEQDWINSALGQQIDSSLNAWFNQLDPAADPTAGACGLICNGADGVGGGTLTQSDGGNGATDLATNSVTGVKVGFSFLDIPVGPFGYDAPTHWYFPTEADGSVQADGVIYLQHGFGAIGWFYNDLATQLAQRTDSIVVVPTVSSIPLPGGAWLNGAPMQEAVASLFLGSEPALNISANQAGYLGTLPVDFMMTGHSAGGGLATAAGGDYVADLGPNPTDNHLLGVVMFDGVSTSSSDFEASIAELKTLDIPDYVVAAPPQAWNAFGATTNELVSLYPDQFVGVELVNGSHVDSMLGGKPLVDFVSQLVTKFSPPGNTAAVYTLASGWINDIYLGAGPTDPVYGVYGPTGDYEPPGGQQIILGQAAGIVLPP